MSNLTLNSDIDTFGSSLTINVEEETGMLICDVCGKEMTIVTDDGERNKDGLSIQACGENGMPREFVQKQLGAYKIGKRYRICLECMFKAYGVKA